MTGMCFGSRDEGKTYILRAWLLALLQTVPHGRRRRWPGKAPLRWRRQPLPAFCFNIGRVLFQSSLPLSLISLPSFLMLKL